MIDRLRQHAERICAALDTLQDVEIGFQLERNREITKAILRGADVADVAAAHNITRKRAYDIVERMCLMAAYPNLPEKPRNARPDDEFNALELSIRAHSRVMQMRDDGLFSTVEDMRKTIQANPQAMMAYKGFGATCLEEVRAALGLKSG